ncbi:MAG: FAD-binding protein [Acidobacteriota bacterium]
MNVESRAPFDLVIVGGGLAGLSAARAASLRGLRGAALEAKPALGCTPPGSSSARPAADATGRRAGLIPCGGVVTRWNGPRGDARGRCRGHGIAPHRGHSPRALVGASCRTGHRGSSRGGGPRARACRARPTEKSAAIGIADSEIGSPSRVLVRPARCGYSRLEHFEGVVRS